jgi:hypothetical protein
MIGRDGDPPYENREGAVHPNWIVEPRDLAAQSWRVKHAILTCVLALMIIALVLWSGDDTNRPSPPTLQEICDQSMPLKDALLRSQVCEEPDAR